MAKQKQHQKQLLKQLSGQAKTPAKASLSPAPTSQPSSATRPAPLPASAAETFDIIRLHFRAPLHLSDARPDDYGNSQRVVHSDALMAAIYQAWAMLGKIGWIPEAIKDEDDEIVGAESPGFVLSSLFPFHGGKAASLEKDRADMGPIYFLPKPYFQNSSDKPNPDLAPGEAKKFKKVQYVDAAFFSAFLHQSAPPDDTTKSIKGAYRSKALAGLTEDEADFLTSDVVPRIAKPQDESEPDPFYMERLYFRHDSGLWAIIRYNDTLDQREAKNRLSAALNYLADNGIGTDRAVGNGQFDWHPDVLPLALPKSGNYAVNLSLFCPSDPESLQTMLDDNARYDLIRRGGWLSEPYNTYRKRSVWMFREGSLMQISERQPVVLGKTVDLQPAIIQRQHPVWRDGRALWLPVNL